jgi:hypothetical protein
VSSTPERVQYGIRGGLGALGGIQLELGGEALLVVRCTVKTISERLDDGDVVADVSLIVSDAARIAETSTIAGQARKLLARAAETDGKLGLV